MKLASMVLLLICTGCTVCVQNRVFPKLAWYWSKDAQYERWERAEQKQSHEQYLKSQQTNSIPK